MWDNPRLLNAAANALYALVALAVLLAGLHALARSPLVPLRELIVRGELAHTSRAQIERAIAGRIGGNFFAADLVELRQSLEALPWVRRVELQRAWPDRIEAALEEHVALARWGDEALLNTHGEPFGGRLPGPLAAKLPLLAGPAGSHAEVARRYARFVEMLAPLHETPERVVLSARHAWQLRTAQGLTLELGRDGAADSVEARLERFVAAWPEALARLARRAPEAQHIDLRYPNGFALRVPEWRG